MVAVLAGGRPDEIFFVMRQWVAETTTLCQIIFVEKITKRGHKAWMRGKQNRLHLAKPISIKLPEEVIERLNALSKKTGEPMSTVARLALRLGLEHWHEIRPKMNDHEGR